MNPETASFDGAPDSATIQILLASFGVLLEQAALFGNRHKVVGEKLRQTHQILRRLLEAHRQLIFERAAQGGWTLNGNPAPLQTPQAEAWDRLMRVRGVQRFVLDRELTLDDLADLLAQVTQPLVPPPQTAASGGIPPACPPLSPAAGAAVPLAAETAPPPCPPNAPAAAAGRGDAMDILRGALWALAAIAVYGVLIFCLRGAMSLMVALVVFAVAQTIYMLVRLGRERPLAMIGYLIPMSLVLTPAILVGGCLLVLALNM